MHRQIAGKLTGPVTKWIVLVAWSSCSRASWATSAPSSPTSRTTSSPRWVPSSAESTEVADQLSGTINPNDIPTLVAYHRDGGLTEDDLAAIDEQAPEIAKIDGVTDEGVLTPTARRRCRPRACNVPTLLSEDGEVAYIYFTFNFGKDGWNKIKEPVDEIRDITAIDGVDVYVGGFGGQAYDFISSFDGSHVTLLLMTFARGHPDPADHLPQPDPVDPADLLRGVAYSVSGGVVYLLAKYADLTVNGQSQAILGILVIGAGTDYALLLVARYREELRRHEDRHEAMAFALHRAAPALLASASTVVVGMLCLSLAELNSTAGLGPVLAVGVGVTVLVMLTLLPALLVVFGRWVFGPRKEQQGTWIKTGLGEIGGGIVSAVANTMAGGVVYLLAKYAGLVVNDQSQYILSILVIGAGTDYALLLVARYREELRRHEDRHEAMAFALHRAAPAIIASAATVVVGLMCLSFADLNSTASLGPVLAVGVARDPAGHGHPAARPPGDLRALDLLAVRPAFGSAEPTQTGFWSRVGDRISVRAARRVDRHRRGAGDRVPRAVQARRQRPVHRGQLHRDARLGHGPEAAGRPRPGRQLQHRSRS